MYEIRSWMQHHKLEVDGCATWYFSNLVKTIYLFIKMFLWICQKRFTTLVNMDAMWNTMDCERNIYNLDNILVS